MFKNKRLSGVDEKPGFRSPESDKLLIKKSKVRYYLPKIILGIIILVFVIFFARVAIWENNYYKEKEGSTRAVAKTVQAPSEQAVDETEVTDADRSEYTVGAEYPRYLTIEKLGIYNARILAMSVTADGAMDVPNNIFDVGWYMGSSKPGFGGTIVIDGHNGGPNIHGVFKELPALTNGDLIKIERGDGKNFIYEVVENVEVPLSSSNAYMETAFASPKEGVESVTLISCTGEWSQVQYTYLSRQFTRAILQK
ncbi:class F sortase [Candidatus Saccharibacteria bacterium]|nr:class F sortase [Candidatus Saccharibacteria bacterium]